MRTKYSNLYTDLLLFVFLVIPSQAIAEPTIDAIAGDITKDTTLIINGSSFTAKVNPKPLLWWKADFGINTLSPLGRKTLWDGTSVGGEMSTTVVAPGSQQSVAFDHGKSSGAPLGRVEFNSDRIYLYRKTYDDFDISKDFAIRTRINLTSGTLSVGDTVTGVTSGAVGIIQSIADDVLPGIRTHYIDYEKTGGTIDTPSPVYFIYGETMTTPSAIMTNAQGSDQYPDGTLLSFNFKTIRFWSALGAGNNIYLSAQGTEPNPGLNITPENTQSRILSKTFTNPLYQIPNAWKVEEVEYQSSSLDTADGTWNFYQNSILGTDQKVITRTANFPNRYAMIYQSQVSNGAQPGSIMHYDSLYIDDTWHRVVICRSGTWAKCKRPEIQIPTIWNDTEINVNLNLGGFNPNSTLFLYVVDQDGVANTNGFALCPKCPLPPAIH